MRGEQLEIDGKLEDKIRYLALADYSVGGKRERTKNEKRKQLKAQCIPPALIRKREKQQGYVVNGGLSLRAS